MTRAARRRTSRHPVLRVIVIAQLVVALLTGTTVALAYEHIDGGIQSGDKLPDQGRKPSEIGGAPLNILIMGTDSRSGSGDKLDDQAGCNCSDTTILLHISADRKDVYGVSLPRDALVTRPTCQVDGKSVAGGTLQFFNAAYSVGGPTCTVEQVHTLTGLYIDHYVVVDFSGFKKMVDAIHGVQVCIPEDVNDQAHGIVLKKGTQTLSGTGALNYVRERYVLSPNADIGRMKRQQAFIASMLNKVISAGTLSHPDRIYHFAEAAAGSVTTDPDLASLGNLVKLARQVRKTNLDDIRFITVPFEEYQPDPNRLVWAPQAQALWKRIKADRPLSRNFASQSITAQSPPGGSSASPSGSASGSPSSSPSASGSPSQSPSASSSASSQAAQEAAANGLCA